MTIFFFSVVAALLPYIPTKLTREAKQHRRRIEQNKNTRQSYDMGMIVAEVATRLRSGSTVPEAWRKTLTRAEISGSPRLDESGVPIALRAMWRRSGWRRLIARFTARRDGDIRAGIPPTIAVCRMTHATGAPAADVLDSCAQGITELAEAEGVRRAALAGPKSSATTLAWLPLLGIALGSVIGARPLHFLTSTTYGYFCLVVGVAFEAAGIIWVRRLVAQAEAAA